MLTAGNLAELLSKAELILSGAISIWYQNPEEIAERLVAADRKKAGEVWWALSDRLASSMSIFFLSGHGIENPR